MGDNWESIQHQLHYLDYAVLAAIVLGVVWLIVRRRRARPGAASPEPEA